jgi:hypothetical protein
MTGGLSVGTLPTFKDNKFIDTVFVFTGPAVRTLYLRGHRESLLIRHQCRPEPTRSSTTGGRSPVTGLLKIGSKGFDHIEKQRAIFLAE